MEKIPNDPMILLSYINTKLRNLKVSLDEFCKGECVDKDEIITKLIAVDFIYDEQQNQFK